MEMCDQYGCLCSWMIQSYEDWPAMYEWSNGCSWYGWTANGGFTSNMTFNRAPYFHGVIYRSNLKPGLHYTVGTGFWKGLAASRTWDTHEIVRFHGQRSQNPIWVHVENDATNDLWYFVFHNTWPWSSFSLVLLVEYVVKVWTVDEANNDI